MGPTVARRTATTKAWQPLELVVRKRRNPRTVAIQWHDSVGDLHYLELTQAQSRPYLRPGRASR